METTDFEDVLREAASEAGADGDNPSAVEFVVWRRFARRRLEVAWRHHYWPDLARCEQRFYRLAYDPTKSYGQAVAGVDNSANEVWWALTGQYFVALTAVPVNTPPTDGNGMPDLAHWGFTSQFAIQPDPTGATWTWPENPSYPQPWVNVQPWDPTVTYLQGSRVQYAGAVYQLFAASAQNVLPTITTAWGLVPPFDAYVGYEQAGFTAFSVVEECFSVNPRTSTRGNRLNWFLSERGVQVNTPIAFAWVQFRLRCPKLSGAVWSAGASYGAGAQVYFGSSVTSATPGNFYTALVTTNAGDSPASAPGSWAVVQIPRMFHRYLVLGMAADWAKHTAGNDPESAQGAMELQGLAQGELDDAKSLVVGQMGQRVKTEVRTR